MGLHGWCKISLVSLDLPVSPLTHSEAFQGRVLILLTGLKEVYGSLTLGGFDTARFISNNVSFNLAPDISRDLVVGLQAITSRDANRSTYSLLASAHLTFIDSTVSEIYLPTDACRLFEQVYGLVWNTSYELYLVEEELHQNLLMRNPVFTFEISDSISNSGPDRPTVEINLPYSSFDLTYKVSYELPSVRYFPIRRAKNDSQMTLGRAFLQEAYVITDYSRGNFSVSQCRFEESMKPNLMPILPANTNLTVDPAPKPTMPQDKGSYLGRTKIAGITVGASLGFLLLFTLCCWPRIARCRRRWRRGSEIKANVSSREDIQRAFGTSYHLFHTPVKQSTPSFSLAKGFHGPKMLQEIDTSSWNGAREVPNNYKVELPENAKRFELSYSISPTPPEQLTRPTDAAQRLQPPTTPRRRHGSILTSGILSPGNIVRHWMRINDLRSSRGESPTSGRTSASAPSKPSFLEKPLPPTPDSESPQESVFPAWIRVAARHYDEQNSHPPPLRQLEEPYRHRRGFF